MSNAMTQHALSLGLEQADLEDIVHDIMLDRANKINDEDLHGQIEFLYSDYCDANPQVFRALLDKIVKEKQAD